MANVFTDLKIRFADANDELKDRVMREWGEKMARHMHIDDGFSMVALQEECLVGLISVYWKLLPPPLHEFLEGYIDIIEVHKDFRRQGIAKQLVRLSVELAKEKDAYQLRAWSSLDKTEAIQMWKDLRFGLCPATTYPHGQEVLGYFVTKLVNKEMSV